MSQIETFLYIQQPPESIFSLFFSGLFTVIGGAIPIILILVLIFFRTRSSFRKTIPSEQKVIEKYEELLNTEETQLQTLNQKIASGEIELNDHIFTLMFEVQKSINEKKQEIVIRNIWIDRVKSASFFGWVGYYFAKSYFSDYFKK